MIRGSSSTIPHRQRSRLPRVALTVRPHDIEDVMPLSKGNAPQWGMFPQKLSVLLVDDEPTVHLAVGSILRQAGYFVEGANDGVAGLRMFKERSWDLVMIDRAMPEMGGEELAEEIRKISPDVPLMLITGFLKSNTRRQLFDGILEKPFTKADLLPITRRLIDKTSRVELQR